MKSVRTMALAAALIASPGVAGAASTVTPNPVAPGQVMNFVPSQECIDQINVVIGESPNIRVIIVAAEDQYARLGGPDLRDHLLARSQPISVPYTVQKLTFAYPLGYSSPGPAEFMVTLNDGSFSESFFSECHAPFVIANEAVVPIADPKVAIAAGGVGIVAVGALRSRRRRRGHRRSASVAE